MKKFIIVLLLFVLLSLSVVSAENTNINNDSTDYENINKYITESNAIHDEFNFDSFSQDEDIEDNFIDDVQDSDAVFNDSFTLENIECDELEGSTININPVTINGGINAGIQSNPDSSEDIKYITVSNYGQLLNAFNDLNTNHDSAVITLAGSTTYTVSSPIVFGTDQSITNVTINAMGHVITGEDSTRFLTVNQGYTLTLNNITIQEMDSGSNGGAIVNKGTLNIYDSVLANNSAYAGGAIYNTGYLFIKNSEIKYNYADLGGAIRNTGRTILYKNSIHHNEATNGNGGVIHSKGIVNSYNNSIRYNSAEGNGAFAYNQMYNLTISNDTIYNNIADYGGVVINKATGTILDSDIYNNVARYNGGVVYNYEDTSTIIKNTNLHNNTANMGGVVLNRGNLSLIKNSIRNNFASNYGGVVSSNAFVNLTGNSIKFNSAKYGGVINNNNGNISLDNNTVYNNSVVNVGGITHNNHGLINSYNNSYLNNTAIGAGVHNNYGLLNSTCDLYINNYAADAGVLFNNNLTSITSSVFENNSAGVFAGVINNNKTLTVDNSTFTGNTVDLVIDSQINTYNNIIYGGYGGVIYNTDNTTITNSNFTDNHAEYTVMNQTIANENSILAGYGGVIYNEGTINTNNSTYSSNYAKLMGAAIYNGGLFNATNNVFEDNTAVKQAGVIVNTNTVIFTDNLIKNNTANDLGGFIYNNADMTLINNTIYENLAGQAAGIYSTDGTSNITNNTFFNNYSPISASAIQITSQTNNTLEGNVFISNNAEVGGTVYINNSRVLLENNNFTSNGMNNHVRLIQTITHNYTTDEHTLLGGCIYINDSVVEINNDSYRNNTATVHASCIYCDDSLILINNTDFSNNSVTGCAGGTIYSDNSTVFIYNSLFENNSALIGGAITHADSKDLTIKNTTLHDNHATKCGGALYVINSPIVLINNTVTENTAGNASSICVLSSPLGSIRENKFQNNNPTDSSSIYLFESNLLIEYNSFIDDNLILNDMGLYSIESNYWAENSPNFHVRTNNVTANAITITNNTSEYKIYLTAPGTVSNNRTIPLNITILDQYNESITTGCVKLEINDTVESIIECTNNSFTYNITIPEDNVGSIRIKATYIDSEDIETELNIFKSIKIISPEDIYFVSVPERARPNEKIQLIVKILKNDDEFINNRKVRAYINNTYMGAFKLSNEKYILNYTIPSGYHGLYNLKISCKDTNLKELTTKNTTIFIESNTTSIIKANISIINGDIDNNTFPDSYDIREDNVSVDFEAQGDSGNCWAFAVLDCLEYSINKQENTTVDFSENNLKNIITVNSIFKSDSTANTGNDLISSIGYLVSRIGPIYENKDAYNMYSQISINESADYHVNDVLFIANRQNTSDNLLIKKAVYSYGSVVSTLHIPEDTQEIADVYDDTLNLPNHAVVVIGWDDNYSKDNFENTPPHDGAFIVKDSVKNDVYYVSYDDVNFGGLYTTQNNNTNSSGLYINNIAFNINTEGFYENIYQHGILAYDGYATLETPDLWINNTYTLAHDEYLTAVGTYALNKSNYTLKIYRNNHLEHTQQGSINTTGYNTIALDNFVPAQKHDLINIIIKITSLDENTTGYMVEKAYKTYNTSHDASSISSDGINWINLQDYPQFTDNYIHTASLKLYTNNTVQGTYKINITPTMHEYNTTDTYTIKVTDNTDNPVTSTQFNITLDNTIYIYSTDNDGVITLDTGVLSVGEHALDIASNDLEINYTTTLTVTENSLEEENDTVYVYLVNDSLVRGMNNQMKVLVYYEDGVRVNSGKIVIKIDNKNLKNEQGRVIYANVVHGEVLFNYTVNSSYTLGEHPLKVVYLRGSIRVEENYTISITRKDINIKINQIQAFYGENIYINATVKTIDDVDVDGATVAFKVNGISLSPQTVANGIVIINQSIPSAWNPGEYNLEMVIGQTSTYNSIRYKTLFSIYNNTHEDDNNLTYSYYYPLYGEYDYDDDNIVDIDITDVNLSVSITYLILELSAPDDYTVYYTTDGQPPTTNSNNFTDTCNVNLRLFPTSSKTINNDHTTTQHFKSLILKYFYIHNGIMSDTYYYQANGMTYTMDNEYSSYLAYIYMSPGIDDRSPEIYTTLNKNTDNTYNLTITANKTGTIQYKINNNTLQTYTPKSILSVNENTTIEITLTTTSGQVMTKNITIHDTNKPLVVVKPVTTYHDGYQNVTFNCDDKNVTIYYTRDGSDPLNTTNIRQANTSTILTLNNLTQLKYYAINQYNITSPVYLYRTPRNEVSPVNISVRKEPNNYNTHKILLQTDNNHTTYYTIDGTIPTTDSYKYTDNEIILHNNTVLNLLLVDQNNYKHYYNYTTLNDLTEYVPINYTIRLANYHNITLPQVTRYNNTLDEYIITEGENGTVMLPFVRTVNIIIANQTYNFVNGQIEGIYNIQSNDYHLTFDGQVTVTNHSNPPKKDGILIYTENNTTILEYHDRTQLDISQFTVEYDTRYNYNTNTVLLVDCIDFNLNNNYKALVETNTLPLETITDTLSDIAVRYQLAREYQYTGDITTSTYNQITNNNIPTIKYTTNNKIIFIVDGDAVYDNFIDSANTIKTSVTINDKNTNRTFALSHKDYEDILRQNLPHNQLVEELENMTYKYTGAIGSYAITNQKITSQKVENIINNFNGTFQLSDLYYIAATKMIAYHDLFSEINKINYYVEWNRTSYVTSELFANASKISVNSFNPEMGLIVSGNEILKQQFIMTTSASLSIIESKIIDIIRNRSLNRSVTPTINKILNRTDEDCNLTYIYIDDCLFIVDDETDILLKVNYTSGQIIDYVSDEEYVGHESSDNCPNCNFNENINNESLIIPHEDTENLEITFSSIQAVVDSAIFRILKLPLPFLISEYIFGFSHAHDYKVARECLDNGYLFEYPGYYSLRDVMDDFFTYGDTYVGTQYNLIMKDNNFGKDIMFKKYPQRASLANGFEIKTISDGKRPSNKHRLGNKNKDYVMIQVYTNYPNYGKYNRSNAYYVHRKGNHYVENLTVEETYYYYPEDNALTDLLQFNPEVNKKNDSE